MKALTTLEAIRYNTEGLWLLDQRLLPLTSNYDAIVTVEDVWRAIREMRVRGAPAIAVSAALGIAVAAKQLANDVTTAEAHKFFTESLAYVGTSRPTAVNLMNMVRELQGKLDERVASVDSGAALIAFFTQLAEEVFASDVAFNENLMKHGAAHLLAKAAGKKTKLNILTICNTGALATSRYGTALGVVRQLFYDDNLERLYACETRPWNQGARLTVYECAQEGIPCTLICDSAVSALMRQGHIDAVIVGADRICQNGDTANKIGTYNVSVAAKYHGVPFYVAAPCTTLDPKTATGSEVVIEERESLEMTHNMQTKERVVAEAPNVTAWNPVFDITPGELITGGLMTDKGVTTPAAAAPFYDIAEILKQ